MPLQLRAVLVPLCHAAFLLHHLYVFFYAHKVHARVERAKLYNLDPRIANITDFAAMFFTNWNMMLQTLYFSLAMLHDCLPQLSPLGRLISRCKGFLFASLVFPCSVFVSAMFWGVYSINREWVLPEVCDEYIPQWLNHSLHTNVLIFLVMEVLIANQLLPSFRSALGALTALTVVYDAVFFLSYFVYGRFMYGLFHVFNWPERIGFILLNYFATVMVMRLGIAIEDFKYRKRGSKAD
ncbi:androgen-dependent TFPI-regulating protein-like [Euwallacea similis]|uniref:androgen-dependent TFPI-regulating protein-like n=1 Tax=Euwallacea similis TaxID=1736056 RepID=UPI00344D9606